MIVEPQPATTPENLEQLLDCFVQQRQHLQVSLADAALHTKYSVAQLTALEAGDWSQLPTDAALRAMLRSYGRYLRIDESLILHAIGNTGRAQMASQSTVNVMQPSLAPVEESSQRSGCVGKIIILAILAAVAAIAWSQSWIPESWLSFDWLSK